MGSDFFSWHSCLCLGNRTGIGMLIIMLDANRHRFQSVERDTLMPMPATEMKVLFTSWRPLTQQLESLDGVLAVA